MDRCDVLIVGGGPAGSSCARELARLGLDVIVMDRSEFPRDKVCAGWITPQIVDALDLDLDEYRRERTLQPLEGFTCGVIGGRSVSVRYREPVSFAIRRCEFDDYLLRRSQARLRLGEPLQSALRRDGGWLINDSIEARLLIGAGGHFCPVARLLGADVGRSESAIYAQEIEFRMSAEQAAACRVAPEQAELYFCPDLAGYGWCVRKGEFLNVGLGREDSSNLSQALQSFWSWLIETGRIAAEAPPHFKGHAYLLHSHSRRSVFADQCLLIGDAAGLAYAQSGEGIRPAVESALLAASTIGAARGDYRATALAAYAARLDARFGPRVQRPAISLRPWRALRQSLARFLLTRKSFARYVLLDRLFLHRAEPALQVSG
jgi:flavin-dependent dehydrogenase